MFTKGVVVVVVGLKEFALNHFSEVYSRVLYTNSTLWFSVRINFIARMYENISSTGISRDYVQKKIWKWDINTCECGIK